MEERIRTKIISDINEPLRAIAKRSGHSLHDSFFVEIDNYSRHQKVCDLDEDDLKASLEAVGEYAIRHFEDRYRDTYWHRTPPRHADEVIPHGPREIGAGAIRAAIDDLCTSVFHPCDSAAQNSIRRLREEFE